MDLARQGRQTLAAVQAADIGAISEASQQRTIEGGLVPDGSTQEEQGGSYMIAPPPGADNVQYASLAGD